MDNRKGDSTSNGKGRPTWTCTELHEFLAVLDPIIELTREIKDLGETKLFSLERTKRDFFFNKKNLYYIETNIKIINNQVIYYKDLRENQKLNGENLESPSEALDWGDPWDSQNFPLYPIIESQNSLEIADQSVIFIKTFLGSSDFGSSENRKVWPEWADLRLIFQNEIEDFTSVFFQIPNPTFIISNYLLLIHQRIQFIQKNLVKISNKMPIIEKKSRLKRLIDLSVSLSISISNKTEIAENDLLEIKLTYGSIYHSISSNLKQVKKLTNDIPTTFSELRNQIADLRANFQKMKTTASVVNNHLLHIKNRLKLQNKLLFEIKKELFEILRRF